MRLRFVPEKVEENEIARSGDATLLRTLAGRYELRGGTPSDRQTLQEWMDLFMPEVAIQMNRRAKPFPA